MSIKLSISLDESDQWKQNELKSNENLFIKTTGEVTNRNNNHGTINSNVCRNEMIADKTELFVYAIALNVFCNKIHLIDK